MAMEDTSILNQNTLGRTTVTGWMNDEDTFIYEVFSRSALEVLAAANRLAAMEEVEWAEPNILASGLPAQAGNCSPIAVDPDPSENPDFGLSWGLAKVRAEEAWAICGGSEIDVLIVIVDDGVDGNHPDIDLSLPGRDFTKPDTCTERCPLVQDCHIVGCPGGEPVDDCDRHGTGVASVASSIINNGVGSAGMAPKVKLVSIRPFFYWNQEFCLTGTGSNAQNPSFGIEAAAVCNAYAWIKDNLRAHLGLSSTTHLVVNQSWNWLIRFACLDTQFASHFHLSAPHFF